MLIITRVDVVDDWTLDIELNNGHLILFDTRRLMTENAGFRSLHSGEILKKPMTDGGSIFWRDGPRLSLEDVMTRLKEEDV